MGSLPGILAASIRRNIEATYSNGSKAGLPYALTLHGQNTLASVVWVCYWSMCSWILTSSNLLS